MGHEADCQLCGLRILVDAFIRNEQVSTLNIMMLYLENNGCSIDKAIAEVNTL